MMLLVCYYFKGGFMPYRYTPAFVAFCAGTPAEEISAEFNIPLKSLQSRIWSEGWKGLATRMAGRITPELTPQDEALTRCEANRARNYEVADKLRDHLIEIVEALRAGTLKVKKQWQYQGRVIEFDAEPTPSDLVNIATYAMTIANLTYRALGDHVATGGYKPDVSAGTPPPAPPVAIVLPSAVARPRFERCLEIEGQVADQGDLTAGAPLALPPPQAQDPGDAPSPAQDP